MCMYVCVAVYVCESVYVCMQGTRHCIFRVVCTVYKSRGFGTPLIGRGRGGGRSYYSSFSLYMEKLSHNNHHVHVHCMVKMGE